MAFKLTAPTAIGVGTAQSVQQWATSWMSKVLFQGGAFFSIPRGPDRLWGSPVSYAVGI